MPQAPKLKAAKAAIRVDFIFADALEQQGWVVDATLLFVHTNFSPTQLLELKRKAGGMKVIRQDDSVDSLLRETCAAP